MSAASHTVPPLATGDRVKLRGKPTREGTIVNTEDRFTSSGIPLTEPVYKVRWDDGETSAWMTAWHLEIVV